MQAGPSRLLRVLISYKHANNWLEAVRTGNVEAQLGAALGMVGSGGLTTTNLYGLNQTRIAGQEVWRAADKAGAWATAGTRLSSLFARLNIAGLVFTVFELGGTWLYNLRA
ncbi:MAG: hypothetical protein SV429_11345 [Pseudomonadota bacterium]|nr:hypothetical protein [Pseudomonadota bacterium]